MDDCDLWEGNCWSDGYGRIQIARIDGKQIVIGTHRLVWMQDNGHTDLMVLHSCDTPNCINIDHLRAGTHQENMDDKMERGRHFETNKTHCKHGHEYTAKNTKWRTPKHPIRVCKTCHNRWERENYHRKKESNYNEQEIN